MQQRAAELEADRGQVQQILRQGAEKAGEVARETMKEVMAAVRFTHYQS